jgi:hypothetical protein
MQNRNEHQEITSPRLPFEPRVVGTETDFSAIVIETPQYNSQGKADTFLDDIPLSQQRRQILDPKFAVWMRDGHLDLIEASLMQHMSEFPSNASDKASFEPVSPAARAFLFDPLRRASHDKGRRNSLKSMLEAHGRPSISTSSPFDSARPSWDGIPSLSPLVEMAAFALPTSKADGKSSIKKSWSLLPSRSSLAKNVRSERLQPAAMRPQLVASRSTSTWSLGSSISPRQSFDYSAKFATLGILARQSVDNSAKAPLGTRSTSLPGNQNADNSANGATPSISLPAVPRQVLRSTDKLRLVVPTKRFQHGKVLPPAPVPIPIKLELDLPEANVGVLVGVDVLSMSVQRTPGIFLSDTVSESFVSNSVTDSTVFPFSKTEEERESVSSLQRIAV